MGNFSLNSQSQNGGGDVAGDVTMWQFNCSCKSPAAIGTGTGRGVCAGNVGDPLSTLASLGSA